MSRLASMAVSALLLSGCAASIGNGIAVSEAWARTAAAGTNSAAYLTLENRGPADQLLSAEAALAGQTQLHRSVLADDGTVRMEPQSAVDLAAGETVRFEPGGLHIMLLDLKQDLEPNEEIRIELRFRDHDPVTILASIRAP